MEDKDTAYSKICFKKLSFERKLEYLWDYYKFHFLGILLVLLLVIGSILTWQEKSKPDLLNGYLLNANWGDEKAYELLEQFANAKGYDLTEYNAYFNSSAFIDTTIQDQMSTVAYTKVMTDLDMKEIDFFFCNQEMFDYFGQREAFINLETVMPADFYQRFEQKLITTDIYDDNGNVIDTYVAGIDISDSPVLIEMQQEQRIYDDGIIYFSIPYNSQRLEESLDFLEFLYSKQQKETVFRQSSLAENGFFFYYNGYYSLF